LNLARTLQGGFGMRQDIVLTDVIDEIGALQHFGGLMARAAE